MCYYKAGKFFEKSERPSRRFSDSEATKFLSQAADSHVMTPIKGMQLLVNSLAWKPDTSQTSAQYGPDISQKILQHK